MMQRAHFHSFLVPHQAVVGDEIHEALEYRRKIGHHAVQDTEHLANYMFRRGNFDECIKLLERLLGGLDEYRKVRTRSRIALSRFLAGKDALASQEVDSILARHESRKGQNVRGFPIGDSSLMLVCARLKRNASALGELRKIEVGIEQAAARGVLWTYSDYPTELAETYLLLDNIDEASKWIDRAAVYWKTLQSRFGIDPTSLIMWWEHRFIEACILCRKNDPQACELASQCLQVFKNTSHGSLSEAERLLQDCGGKQPKLGSASRRRTFCPGHRAEGPYRDPQLGPANKDHMKSRKSGLDLWSH